MTKVIALLLLNLLFLNGISQDINATQKFPDVLEASKNYTIETTINKGKNKSFLMFSQLIPKGFQINELDTKGGRLKYNDSVLKVTWIIPPSEESFTITYQLVVLKNPPAELTIGGSVFYIVDSVKKEFKLSAKTVKIDGGNPQTSESSATSSSEKQSVKEPETSVPIENIKTEIKNKEKSSGTSSSSNKGITYRVQIGAFKTKPNLKGVSNVTSINFDSGITKYYSGDYTSKEEAVEQRNRLVSKGFKDAFVVRFENGNVIKN